MQIIEMEKLAYTNSGDSRLTGRGIVLQAPVILFLLNPTYIHVHA